MSDPINKVAPPTRLELHVDLMHPAVGPFRPHKVGKIVSEVVDEIRQSVAFGTELHGEIYRDGKMLAYWIVHTCTEEEA